ncbi:unnamed protein product [Paramecium sonneborni]|uniref:Ankyrin repeat protein n=1 Tax=Paramecium sonneborni TaxID=65129 RepID=A0A8S1QX12_9CILI|nr:unnamed protein product [Paramecium sonneborni]
MNNNFGSHFHLKTDLHILPQSEVYIRQISQEDDAICNNHVRTYSLGIEKASSDKFNTISQLDTGKHELNQAIPLLVKQQTGSEFQINVDNLIQFNQQSLTFMNSNYITNNFIKLGSNNEFLQNEDDNNRPFTPPQEENNVESKIINNVMISPRKSCKFKAAGNLVLGIRRLQQNVVEQITSSEQFYEKFNPSPCQTTKNIHKVHPIQESKDLQVLDRLNQFKLVFHLTQHSQSGSSEDIQQMMKIIQKDPKRNLTNPQDPNHIINQFNQYGQNSLYIACKNGNDKVVKYLLSLDCNAHIKSRVYDDLTESPLDVSVRWHHYECVKLLLNQIKYNDTDLRSALKISQNPEITNLIKRKMSSSLFSCCL